ncbi:MAG: excinuclease ABC subunit UvrC [Clostridia bacterium]|nr:excinuclease ABC subunit UvrC [Clostridia bacterium]
MFNIKEELKKLPDSPGIYIMKDKNDKVIYVGKAISLKNRVKSYFRKSIKTKRIENMISLIHHFEYIVVDNEAEALILECNLIKKFMPKFNVLLKDDKTFPYIKINVKDDYPSVYITRKVLKDGAKYFGPYTNVTMARQMVNFIKEKFKIRQCKNFKYKDRACLNYQIKKCMAPCMKYISKEDYKMQINQIIDILDGKVSKLLKELNKQMVEASNKMDYEKAAYIRDKIKAIEVVTEKQKVSNLAENEIDVIGIAKNDYEVCIEVFFIRNRKMLGRESYFFKDLKDEDNRQILSEFVKQYYLGSVVSPNKIMLRENIEDKEILQELLSKKNNKKIEIKVPKKGEKVRLIEMVENNAKITLDNKYKEKINVLEELKHKLILENLPRKIETYDISNISGQYLVSAMCVAQDGEIRKNRSKLFKIKTVLGQNDVACMQETIIRRMEHYIKDGEDGNFGRLPDLILADGGITQINAIKEIIIRYGFDIPVYGMVKDDKHKTRALIDSNRKEYEVSEKLMNFITLFQDTVHNTAIGYHKKLRDKEITKSELDSIKGIGEVKKKQLIKHFGSVAKIKEAKIEEIMNVKGINKELAMKIKREI